MDDLIAFITARLDEDELAAKNAGADAWDFTGTNCEVRTRERKGYGEFGRIIAYCRHGNPVQEDLALAIHIARHDPARALREVAAKRKLIAGHGPGFEHDDSGGKWKDEPENWDPPQRMCTGHEWAAWPCQTMLVVASVWSDHPDYEQEWAT